MKRLHYIFCFALLVTGTGALCDEIPVLHLEEGIHEVSLSVVNSRDVDLHEVRISFDSKKMPEWLSIHDTDQTINVSGGERASEKFILAFEVVNAPSNAFAEIPYTLKDNKGNTWNYSVKIHVGSIAETEQPAFNALYENYPNPFNPTTTITYSLSENSRTKLVIYNTLGQEVRTLVNAPNTAGFHTVLWDGRNDNGQKISSGVYFYKLTAGTFIQTKRMMLVE